MDKERTCFRNVTAERLRRSRRSATMCCILALLGQGWVALGADPRAVVTGEQVNLRSRPSLQGEVLTQLNAGTVLSLLDKSGLPKSAADQARSWVRIRLPATVPVWVHSAYVKAGTVQAAHVNVRSGPGEHFSSLGQLQSGEKLTVRARSGNWLQVAPPAQAQAYVAASYLAPWPQAQEVRTPTPINSSNPPRAARQEESKPPGTRVIPPSASQKNSKPLPALAIPSAPIAPKSAESAGPAAPARVALPSPPASLAKAAEPPPLVSPRPMTPPQETAPETRAPAPAIVPSPAFPEMHSAAASDASAGSRFALETPSERPKNEFSLGYFLIANASAQFKNPGGVLLAAAAPAGEYDDGYVRPSSRGDFDGYTWNWGYEHASQVDVANDRLIFSRASVLPDGGFGTGDRASSSDLGQGVEWGYHRLLWDRPDRALRLGLEASFGYGWMEFHDAWQQTADLRVDRDAYPLNGVHLPPPPYHGTFQEPQTLIYSQPTAWAPQTLVNAATVASERTLDLDLYNFRLGPRLTANLTPRLFGLLSGGLALTMVDGTFSYRDTAQPGANLHASGQDEKFSLLPGGYVGLGLGYQLSRSLAMSYQLHLQFNDSYRQDIGGRSVELDLKPAVFQTFGLSYSF